MDVCENKKSGISRLLFTNGIHTALKTGLFCLMVSVTVYTGIQVWGNDTNIVIKGFFLYQNSQSIQFQKPAILSVFILFSILLFNYFFYTSFLLGVSPKHRNLFIQRYTSKKNFIFRYAAKSVTAGFFSACVSTFSFFSFVYIWPSSFFTSVKEILPFLTLQCINLFLFFAICVFINIYITLKSNEIIATIFILIMSFFVMLADIYIKPVSILTYGDISAQLIGICLQILTVLFFNIFMLVYTKKCDF